MRLSRCLRQNLVRDDFLLLIHILSSYSLSSFLLWNAWEIRLTKWFRGWRNSCHWTCTIVSWTVRRITFLCGHQNILFSLMIWKCFCFGNFFKFWICYYSASSSDWIKICEWLSVKVFLSHQNLLSWCFCRTLNQIRLTYEVVCFWFWCKMPKIDLLRLRKFILSKITCKITESLWVCSCDEI